MKTDSEMVQKVVEQAKANLKTSELLPTFFVGNTDKMVMIGAQWEDEGDKDMVAYRVKRIAHEIGADYVIFVSESWTIKPEDAPEFMANRDKYRSVSDFPKCFEVVMFSIETPTSMRMGMAPILEGREMGEIKWHQPDQSEGRFSNFLGKKPTLN
jgi:hypothetical protein